MYVHKIILFLPSTNITSYVGVPFAAHGNDRTLDVAQERGEYEEKSVCRGGNFSSNLLPGKALIVNQS